MPARKKAILPESNLQKLIKATSRQKSSNQIVLSKRVGVGLPVSNIIKLIEQQKDKDTTRKTIFGFAEKLNKEHPYSLKNIKEDHLIPQDVKNNAIQQNKMTAFILGLVFNKTKNNYTDV